MKPLPWVYDDGGRAGAGFKGHTGDCVVRAVAIATGESYATVYEEMREAMKRLPAKLRGRSTSPRDGVPRAAYEPYLLARGWKWVPTMGIGTGCQVHLAQGAIPHDRLIARVSKHMTAIIDGTLHDTADHSRGGTRCVYGYFIKSDPHHHVS